MINPKTPWSTSIEPSCGSSSPIENVNKPLLAEAKSQLIERLEKLYPAEIISKIILGYESNWQGFVQENGENTKLYRQLHNIPGLKVYFDIQKGQLVADVAVGVIGRGSFKKAKKEHKILADGSIQNAARNSRAEKDPYQEGAWRSPKIQEELDIRERLGPILHLLPFVHSGSYINKKGKQKERYESPLCDGNLETLSDSIRTDPKMRIQSLHIFLDALSALADMHAQGFIHRDFKPKNIFFKGDQGFLADLGLATYSRDYSSVDCSSIGTKPYLPGGFSGDYDPQIIQPLGQPIIGQLIEMFSVGATLLDIYRQDLKDEFSNIQQDYWDDISSGKEWADRIANLQDKLVKKPDGSEGSDLDKLIAQLIDPVSTKHPSSAETKERLTDIIFREELALSAKL